MSEVESITQIQKPKTSKLAIASLCLCVFAWASEFPCLALLAYVAFNTKIGVTLVSIGISVFHAILILLMLGLVFGIIALCQIHKSNGRLKGKTVAIIAITIAGLKILEFFAVLLSVLLGGFPTPT